MTKSVGDHVTLRFPFGTSDNLTSRLLLCLSDILLQPAHHAPASLSPAVPLSSIGSHRPRGLRLHLRLQPSVAAFEHPGRAGQRRRVATRSAHTLREWLDAGANRSGDCGSFK